MFKKLLFFLGPIILAVGLFGIFSLFLSQATQGKGALQVTSLPISAVYLNGKAIGKTPLCKCEANDLLSTGEYTLKLVPTVGDNISPYEQKITITKGILTVVDRTFGAGSLSSGFVITLTPLADSKATQLFLGSFPSDATVTVDGNEKGNSPLTLKDITPSDHEVVIAKSGYKDKTIHIRTNMGYQLNAFVTLAIAPLDASSSAALEDTPLTPVQKTKVVILQTPTGFLRVRSDPSLAGTEVAQVKPGESYELLDERDGWYQIKVSDHLSGWVSASYAQKQ